MWRSLLFVPILEDRLVAGAPRRNADAVVLDLEAAVPSDRKEEARNRLGKAVADLRDAGARIAVRVNRLDEGGEADIAAVVAAEPDALVLPMATAASTQRAAVLAGSQMPLIALIEDARGVIDALRIAEAAPSVVALGFGVEDYASDMGAPPTPDLLEPAAFQVIQAARAAGRYALVLPDSIADYRNLERFENAARKGRALGSSGSFAIHPAQIEILNRTFTPSPEERAAALRIVEAAEAARRSGQAVTKLEGRMIDAPVEARARAILARGGDATLSER